MVRSQGHPESMSTRFLLRVFARVSVVVGFFTLVTLSLKACHSLPLDTQQPAYSLIAQYPDASMGLAHADVGPTACCTMESDDRAPYPAGMFCTPSADDQGS